MLPHQILSDEINQAVRELVEIIDCHVAVASRPREVPHVQLLTYATKDKSGVLPQFSSDSPTHVRMQSAIDCTATKDVRQCFSAAPEYLLNTNQRVYQASAPAVMFGQAVFILTVFRKDLEFTEDELNALAHAAKDMENISIPKIVHSLFSVGEFKARYEENVVDPLTGLHRRDALIHDLGVALSKGIEGSLTIFDLDDFRLLNGILGHESGDTALLSVSQILKQVAGNHGQIYRFGGDEFAVLSEQKDFAHAIALECRNQIKRINLSNVMQYSGFGCTVAIRHFNNEDSDPNSVMTDAEETIYKAKRQNKDSITIFDKAEIARLDHLACAMSAMNTGGLTHFYQPIIDLKSHDVKYFEVLSRIKEKGKLIMPQDFIPFVEQTSLIKQIDYQSACKAIRDLARIREEDPSIRFSINLSGKTIEDTDLARSLVKEIKKADLDPEAIAFEITETFAIQKPNHAHAFIAAFTDLGSQFILDDYGSGASSFEMLKRFDISTVKIDGSFVVGALTNNDDKAFIENIFEIAQQRGIQTVAEYVESYEILNFLIDVGIDLGQGFLFSKPQEELPVGRYATA